MLAPAAVVGAVAVALLLRFDVAAWEIVRLAAYELVFVVVPGVVVFRALAGRRSLLEHVAFGWGLGYALELAAFALTGELGLRDWFAAYPALAIAAGLALTRARNAPEPGRAPPLGRAQVWVVAATCVAIALYLALAGFATAPLPWTVERVWYYTDLPFHLSIAAEAKHHWPVTDASAAGLAFPYHVGADLHVAAAGRVTDVALPVVLLRFFPLTLALLVVLQLVAAGRRLSGRAAVGVAAAPLALLVGELDLDSDRMLPFSGTFAWSFWISPSFLLGLALFVPAVALIGGRLAAGPSAPGAGAELVVVALLVGAAAATKASIPLVLCGGLVLYAAWQLVLHRRTSRIVLASLGVVAAAGAVVLLGLYSEAGGRDLALSPVGAFRNMPQLVDLGEWLGDSLPGRALFALAATGVGSLALYGAALAGIPLLIAARRHTGLGPERTFLLCMLAAGLAPLLAVHQGGFSELYFSHYGFVAGALLSAEGLLLVPAVARAHPRPFAAAAGVVAVAAAVGLAGAPWPAYAILAGGLALLAVRGLRRGRRAALVAVACGAVLVGALDLPLDVGARALPAWLDGRPQYAASEAGLTRDLYAGLAWLRDNTSERAVLAVNNYDETNAGDRYPSYYGYAAFAERRVFLQGWLYGPLFLRADEDVITPRLKLNEAVFDRADPRALETLVRDYGVRYLVVDRVHGTATPRLARLGRVVYRNPDVTVYAVGG